MTNWAMQQPYGNNYGGISNWQSGTAASRYGSFEEDYNWNSPQKYSGLPPGKVTTSGITVTLANGAAFVTGGAWSGAAITINSVGYTISSVSSASSLTLTTSAGMQSTPVTYSVAGYGQLGTMAGFEMRGPVENGIDLWYPPFGSYFGDHIGTIVQRCFDIYSSASVCNTWNQGIPIINVQNENNTSQGEDLMTYNPTSASWQLTSGATNIAGQSATNFMNVTPMTFGVSVLAVGSGHGCLHADTSGNLTTATSDCGSVTSVTFSGDGIIDSLSPSTPVTSSGTVAATPLTQNPNTVLAGPSSGSAAAPTFRALASADIPTSTWWVAPFLGNASANLSGSSNTVRGWGFTVPAPVTFSNIYAESNTPDGSGLYSVGIACGAGPSGSTCTGSVSQGGLICHPTPGINVPSAHMMMTNTCSEGSVTIYPGNVYILLGTGNTTTGLLQGSGTNGFILPYYNATMSGCSSASGVITGPCSSTTPMAAVNGSSVPSFTLH